MCKTTQNCLTHRFRNFQKLFICILINRAALRKNNTASQKHAAYNWGGMCWNARMPSEEQYNITELLRQLY
jgi:hypothetical protein